MGSMMKADSDRRELMRERRQARIERKQQRREARDRKRSPINAAPPAPPALSAIQRAAQEEVDAALDRIVTEALERHDQVTATADAPDPASTTPTAMHVIDPPAGCHAARRPRGTVRQLVDRAYRRKTAGHGAEDASRSNG